MLSRRLLLDARRGLRWPLTGVDLALLTGSFGLLAAGRDRLGWYGSCATAAARLTGRSLTGRS